MFALIKTLILLLIAVLLAAVGLLVPAHIRSVDSSVIEYAGTQGTAAADFVWGEVNAVNTGPAQLISAATLTTDAERRAVAQRIAGLTEKHPQYTITGGPAPYFENFLGLTQSAESLRSGRNAVLSILLPRNERAFLGEMLGKTSNTYVTALLEARNLRGLLHLHPADHPAGAPYDAGVLTLALLTQGGHFKPGLANEIGHIASQAVAGQPAAVKAMEDLVIATLSIARQLDFRSLASLATITKTPSDWAQIATIFRTHADRIAQVYTALYFSEAPESLYNYLAEQAGTAEADLDFALQHGPAAVQFLLETEQPLFKPSAPSDAALALLQPYRPSILVSLTHADIAMGQMLKFGLFLIAGFFFSLAMGAAWRGSVASETPVSRHNPAVMARDALISIVVVITLWTFIEPDLLKAREQNIADTGPRIEFAVADTLQSLKTPVKAMQELNQVTLLVLALFFIVQLVIYCFCLIKLREIDKQQLSPDLKIKLIDNEDNLFDFGLYVGLGGTVLSLILVAVGIVEASLMAAYASTLFGIIFTAMLKVLHLRPYRRNLLVEADSTKTTVEAGTFMKDIEL